MVLPPFDDASKPVVQLINQPTGATAVSVDFGVVIDKPETWACVRGLYPHGRRIILDSDRQMQRESPAQVVDAIRDVVASATKQGDVGHLRAQRP